MSDVRSRIEDDRETHESGSDARQSKMWNALPVLIEKYNAAEGTLEVQPAIKSTIRKADGKQERVQLPLIKDAPVAFPQGGGFTMTFPMTKGDEAIAIFSSRSIDQWHQSGGIQQQVSARMHDLSDALIIPGVRSKPRKLTPAPSTTSTELRSDDGTIKITMGANLILLDYKGTLVQISADRVDLGGLGGPKVLTEAGPARNTYAVV